MDDIPNCLGFSNIVHTHTQIHSQNKTIKNGLPPWPKHFVYMYARVFDKKNVVHSH